MASAADISRAVQTYHCVCSQFLFATSAAVSSLPRRAAPAQDRARILVLRPAGGSNDDDDEEQQQQQQQQQQEGRKEGGVPGAAAAAAATAVPVTEMAGLAQDAVPVVVQRDDGYERRWIWRCRRCDLVAAYALRESVADAGGPIYLLEDHLRTTEAMMKKK